MRNTAICSCLIFALLLATSVQAESFRTTVKKSAKSNLNLYFVALEKMKKGERLCGIGSLSNWGATITRVSDEGRSNGLEPGDKFLKINGEQVTETNSARIIHKYKPDDELTLIIERNQGEIELNIICHDRTETLEAFASMLQAAAKGRWQQCIDNSYVADRLNGETIGFSALYRLNCNEAKRCGWSGCKTPTNQDAQLVYDYRVLALEEATVAGTLYEIRSDILIGITWLEDNNFRGLANDLGSRLRNENEQLASSMLASSITEPSTGLIEEIEVQKSNHFLPTVIVTIHQNGYKTWKAYDGHAVDFVVLHNLNIEDAQYMLEIAENAHAWYEKIEAVGLCPSSTMRSGNLGTLRKYGNTMSFEVICKRNDIQLQIKMLDEYAVNNVISNVEASDLTKLSTSILQLLER